MLRGLLESVGLVRGLGGWVAVVVWWSLVVGFVGICRMVLVVMGCLLVVPKEPEGGELEDDRWSLSVEIAQSQVFAEVVSEQALSLLFVFE